MYIRKPFIRRVEFYPGNERDIFSGSITHPYDRTINTIVICNRDKLIAF